MKDNSAFLLKQERSFKIISPGIFNIPKIQCLWTPVLIYILLSTIAAFLLPFILIFLRITAYEKNSAHTIKAAIRFFLGSYSFVSVQPNERPISQLFK
jgi:hypothetical protein